MSREVRGDPDVDVQERIRRQFEARHADFDRASRWATDAGLLRAFVDAVEPAGHQVLEICCGTGLVGAALAEADCHVVGADISPHMLSIAEARVAEVVRADACDLPFPDACFERIVMRQAWHFVDPGALSREVFRVAAPGAIFVTGQIVPFGEEDAEHQRQVHALKQPDLLWFPTEPAIEEHLVAAGWTIARRQEVLIEEELGDWLRWAPETGDRAAEVERLVRESPEPYRRLHRVREDGRLLWETFRWILLVARKPGEPPRVRADLLEILRCPACRSSNIEDLGSALRCGGCGASYPVDAGIPRFRTGGGVGHSGSRA